MTELLYLVQACPAIGLMIVMGVYEWVLRFYSPGKIFLQTDA